MKPSSLLSIALLPPIIGLNLVSAATAEVSVSTSRLLQNENATDGNETATPTSSPTSPSTAAPSQTAPAPWGGCIDPREANSAIVVRGRPTPICLTVGPGGHWNRVSPSVEYLRYSFKPTADEYSVYQIPDSFNNFIVREEAKYLLPNITVFAATGTALSFLRHWYEKNQQSINDGKIFPHLTAVIDVKQGVVSGISWDNACVFCRSQLCLENTYNFNGEVYTSGTSTKGCYLTYEQCVAIHAGGGNECDLTLFVVWTGSDANGNVMSSSNSRFSAFEPQQIQDRWGARISDSINSVTDKVSDITDSVNEFGQGVQDAVTNPFGLGGNGDEGEGQGEG
eukprot:CAMPEP_0197464400 /NCGR_PEP_ID=MMETSP1175-20131217/64001_1 /TAXON_ID=1003142 /ORGANISM="Triceratium dubium, Strain CCMP147" /LENGTH=337 /DNA_ID=CAMNT_0043000379 /DNA_START=20 /DNA_END=1033 /DNA_ORIENTATION=+